MLFAKVTAIATTLALFSLACDAVEQSAENAPTSEKQPAQRTPTAEQRSTEANEPAITPRDIAVEQLAEALKSDDPPKVFDANGQKTRDEYGLIPGATPLTSSSKYELSVLPDSKDDKLVFYCSNQRCKAGEGAAKKAAEAGYKDINVLRAGIAGWVKAGHPTTRVN